MKSNRRGFLRAAGCGAALAASGALRSDGGAEGKLPNIILCMADDQGWGDMGYNGHPRLQTPHFDAMSRETLRFDRFYAAAPVCSPTRGSVMTGRHPNRFGCFKWGHPVRPQEITIAEALRTAGYVTGHFGKWHLGTAESGSPANPGACGFDEWLSAPNFFDNDPILAREGVAVQTRGESSMVTVDAAIEFVRRKSKTGQPFLAVVWFGSPHNPHEAVDRDREPYKDLPEKQQHFLGEITGMDRAFGKLRQELRNLEIHENTILWYCSDNGGLPNLGATGGRGHKGQVYEGGLRVPAMLEWPARLKNPRQTALPCNTSDIYPTLLEIAGVEIENQPPLDGVSLVPLLEGPMEARPKPMGFWNHPTGGVSTPSRVWMAELLEAQKKGQTYSKLERLRLDAAEIAGDYPEDRFPGHSAWLDWPWKLHRIENQNGVTFELYNLEVDPMESSNQLEGQTAKAGAMTRELEAWLASVARSLNGADYTS